MTGKHTGHAFVRDNREMQPEGQLPLPAEEITLGERFHSAGYATAAIGKWGLGMVDTTGDPKRQGFDLFFGYHCQRHAHNHYPRFLRRNSTRVALDGNTGDATGASYAQDRFREEALSFIRSHQDTPFFLYLPFAVPHLGIQVPEASLAEYVGQIPEADYEHRGYRRHPYPRAGYAAMVSHLDRDVGQLLALLEELSLNETTLVIFTSDNGPTYDRLGGSDSDFFQSAGRLRGRKGSVYEGGLRVPLLVQWTGQVAAGTTTDQVAGFCDMTATLADLVGLPTNTVPSDGISFAATLRGEAPQPRHELMYWEFPAYGGQQAARSGDWKLVRTGLQRGAAALEPAVELYDLASDAAETVNVAPQNPAVVEKMLAEMQRQHIPSKEFPFARLDDEAAGGTVARDN